MTAMLNVQEAKTRLSELLRLVERGEDVVIARAGKGIARLQAIEPVARRFDKPLLPGIPAADDALVLSGVDSAELAAWEQGHPGDPLGEALR
ncbi:type II toxin-antitoxin system prevent-host-death family antitoxin [Leucobacter coleopterorum]|uniref:Type II toxin-antitoxin system prevent-host-death family antitoxin n=1 Tax=Leucobacter coleopterorum TaxID=2714933 RepID=A0ABX6JV98_9MICO|nr:type II toxin-antitoxin system prevent-host-death family antitoxin [Leucobacter coleopterorum]QIM18221.1 type II toxin-antitoxin system prevent-host-death family antitoxin [Leucobacter coleopterorum]